jgi:hypothetical protein
MDFGHAQVVLLERGQAVEQRGRDIGALFARGIINPDSNLCYGQILELAAQLRYHHSTSTARSVLSDSAQD